MTPTYYGIVANVVSDKVLRAGAKIWIAYTNGDAENPKVIGMSRGGRIVEKYTTYKRLAKFRSKSIPLHLLERIAWKWEEREEAESFSRVLNERWEGVRFFKDGKILQDGVTVSEAFAR